LPTTGHWFDTHPLGLGEVPAVRTPSRDRAGESQRTILGSAL
jgi:hypothetical protein